MNYGDAFTFIFKDKDWLKKLGIASAFGLLVPLLVGMIPLMGWGVEIARRVIRGDEEILPGWSDLGSILKDGLKAFGVYAIWSAPIWLLSMIMSGAGAAAGILSDDSGMAAASVSMLSLCVSLFSFLYGIVMSLLLVGAFGILAADGEFSKALNPVNAYNRLKANLGDHILTVIIASIGSSLAAVLGVILCVIGVVIGMAYGFALIGHLYGQVYRQTEARLLTE